MNIGSFIRNGKTTLLAYRRREAYEEKVIIYDKDGAREQEVNDIPVRAIRALVRALAPML